MQLLHQVWHSFAERSVRQCVGGEQVSQILLPLDHHCACLPDVYLISGLTQIFRLTYKEIAPAIDRHPLACSPSLGRLSKQAPALIVNSIAVSGCLHDGLQAVTLAQALQHSCHPAT